MSQCWPSSQWWWASYTPLRTTEDEDGSTVIMADSWWEVYGDGVMRIGFLVTAILYVVMFFVSVLRHVMIWYTISSVVGLVVTVLGFLYWRHRRMQQATRDEFLDQMAKAIHSGSPGTIPADALEITVELTDDEINAT